MCSPMEKKAGEWDQRDHLTRSNDSIEYTEWPPFAP